MYILFCNGVQGQTIRNGRYLLLNGLLCCAVLSKIRSHCDKLHVIMEFRMRRCDVLYVLLESYRQIKKVYILRYADVLWLYTESGQDQAQLPRYDAGTAFGMTKVLNESAGRVGAIILLPITRRTGISSQRSFCTTTTMLPSGLANASWFS
jgi:hypothetical protein